MQRSELVRLLGVLEQADRLFPEDISQMKTKQDVELRLALVRLKMKVQKRISKLKPTEKP